MKKEDLIKLGLDEETATTIAAASATELTGYIPKVRFDEVNTAKKQLELDIVTRDGQLDTLKKSTGDVEALKKTIETLQGENTTSKTKYDADIKNIKITNAVDAALTAAKAKNLKAAKGLLDLSKVELDAEGNVKGLAEQIKSLTEAEDSKFMFDGEVKKTKFKGTNPGETGKEDLDDRVDTSKMNYEELAAYMTENPETK